MIELLGYESMQLGPWPLWDFLEPNSRQEALQLWEQRWLGAQELHHWRFLRKDGSELAAAVATNPLYDDQARFAGVVCMVTESGREATCEESMASPAEANAQLS
jgi:PAS domain S-box-containing protein